MIMLNIVLGRRTSVQYCYICDRASVSAIFTVKESQWTHI